MSTPRLQRVRAAARIRHRRLTVTVGRQRAQASYLGWVLLALLPVVALLSHGGPWFKAVLIVLVSGVFLSYVTAPMVDQTRRRLRRGGRPISRDAAIAIVYVGLCIVVASVWLLFAPRFARQVAQLRERAPAHIAATVGRLRSVDAWAERSLPIQIHQRVTATTTWVSAATHQQGIAILRDLSAGLAYVRWLVLAPVVAVALLRDAHRARRTLLRAVPRGHVRWRLREFSRDVNRALAGYVRAQLLSALIVGSACAVGLALLRVPYAFLLGVAGGVLEFVPAVGPLAVAVAAASLTSGTHAALVLIFLGAIRGAQDYLILPRLVGTGMRLHPAVVVLALWSGALVGGVAGVFVALPVVGVVVTVARHLREYREIERLVARGAVTSQPPLVD